MRKQNQILAFASGLTVLACCMLAVVQILLPKTSKTELAMLPFSGLEVVAPVDPFETGADVYSVTSKSSSDALSRDIAAGKAEHKKDMEAVWTRRKAQQAANNARMYAACENDPSIPGCPYTPPADIYFVSTDPDEAKQDIYSIENKVAQDSLKKMVAQAKMANLIDKFQVELKAYADAIAGDRRMLAACANDPSLPGCPYKPPQRAVPQLGSDPTAYGANIYSFTNKQAQDSLKADLARARAERKALWLEQQAELAARQQAGLERIAVACQNDPSLPGCPY